MTRISYLVRTTAFIAQIVAMPVLAATPAQEFIDHFTAQPVVAAAAPDVSTGSPSAEYLARLKGDTGGYVAGPKLAASPADPRQQFLDQLAVHPTVGAHDARANLADAK